jgi:hypothetical protein
VRQTNPASFKSLIAGLVADGDNSIVPPGMETVVATSSAMPLNVGPMIAGTRTVWTKWRAARTGSAFS